MNLNRGTALALVAGAVALTAACSEVTHGTITSKQYVPEYHWIYEQPIHSEHCYSSYKGSTSCSSYITGYIPIPMTDPACWKLNLKNSSGDTGHVCVDQKSWDKAKVGGQW